MAYLIEQNALHVSTAQAFAKCPRSYYYAYIRGWRPQTDMKALYFGTAWHKFLELLEGGAEDPIAEILKSEEAQALDEYDAQTLCALALCFMERYPKWGDPAGGMMRPEVPFSVDLGNTAWRFGGTIDAICPSGLLVEHKTTSADIADGADYWTRLKFNLQILMYALITGSDRALYNVVRKPTIRPRQVPVLDENKKKIVLSLTTGERLYKLAPARDENGLKIVRDCETGERVFLKNGKPAQTAKEGQTYVEQVEGEPYESAKAGESVLQTALETPSAWGERLAEDIRSRPEYYFAQRVVELPEEMKQEALLQCLSVASEIDGMKARAELLASIGKDRALGFRRNCSEFNCAHCPYQGICLDNQIDTDSYAETEAPEGFMVQK